MAYYLKDLPNGRILPGMGKARFIENEIPGSKILYRSPLKREENMIAIVRETTFDSACWIDIDRQFEICSMPDERPILWMIVPGIDEHMKKKHYKSLAPKSNSNVIIFLKKLFKLTRL